MNKQITEVFTCKCKPDFNWKNNNTYRAHFNSNRHQKYEKNYQEKENRKIINKLEIELKKLIFENNQLRELYLNCSRENLELKNKINNYK